MTNRVLVLLITLSAACGAPAAEAPVQSVAPAALTIEVGSPEVDGRMYPPHRARNRVYPPGATTPSTTWTNELTHGDSAGVPVHRWVTLGTQPSGATWELRQTYNARTLAPMTYAFRGSSGGQKVLFIQGTRVTGWTQAPNNGARNEIDWSLPRLGFMSNASDLVPPAVGMRAGSVISLPIWGVDSIAPVQHQFRVLDQVTVDVEGERILAWKIEERVEATGELEATWYMIDRSPYMVLAEIPTPNGIQRITGVDLD